MFEEEKEASKTIRDVEQWFPKCGPRWDPQHKGPLRTF